MLNISVNISQQILPFERVHSDFLSIDAESADWATLEIMRGSLRLRTPAIRLWSISNFVPF